MTTTQKSSAILLGLWTALVLLFLFAPLLLVALFSFNSSEISVFPIREFTLRWYEQLAANEEFRVALGNSLTVAGATVVLATSLGLMAATGAHRYAPRLRTALRSGASLPMMVPHLILGIALLGFYNLVQIDLSLGTVIMGHSVVAFPYVFLIVSARLVGFDSSLEEAARDLGAGPARIFWEITLPLLAPAILTAALISFTLSFDEVVVTFFTTGTDNTLPMVIWSMLRVGITPEINAIATLTVVVSCVMAGIAEVVIRRSRQTSVGKGE
jgi:spermidine/putrescine transport system permease protein